MGAVIFNPRWEFGERVRAVRMARGWSQEQLAEVAGLHTNSVGGIERGQWNVPLLTIYKLARALGVRPAELLADEPDTDAGSSDPG